MKYIKFPVETLNEVPQELLDELHLSPRKSLDGTEVLMKACHFDILFPQPMTLEIAGDDEPQEVVYPYPAYDGEELEMLLSNPDWSASENTL